MFVSLHAQTSSVVNRGFIDVGKTMSKRMKKITVISCFIVLYGVLLGRARLIFGGDYFSIKNVGISLLAAIVISVIAFAVYSYAKTDKADD